MCIKANVQNLVNNVSTRTTWVMLFWWFYRQLQRCAYWGLSWASTMELFCNSMGKSWNFQLGYKYISETLNRFYFDYLTLIWLDYLRISYQFHEHIYSNISKIHLKKKLTNLMLKTNMAYYRNLRQRSILARKGNFLWKKVKIKLCIIFAKGGSVQFDFLNIF